MAGLASLLSDPNYTGANDATKQAIFDKFAPQDSNFSGANPETQMAIRSKFGLVAPVATQPSNGIPSSPRATGTAVEQIPGYGGAIPASTQPVSETSYPQAPSNPTLRALKAPFAGAYRGLQDITDTGLIAATEALGIGGARAESQRQKAQFEQEYGGTPGAEVGRIGGQIIGTLPVGGLVAAPVKAAAKLAPSLARFLTPVATSLETAGFQTGVKTAGANAGVKLANVANRAVGGGVTGAAAATAVNPDDAETGAIIGALVPTVGKGIVQGVTSYGRKLKDIKSSHVIDIVEDRGSDIVKALESPNALIVPGSAPTAGEVAASAGSTKFSAETKRLGEIPEIATERAAQSAQSNMARIAEETRVADKFAGQTKAQVDRINRGLVDVSPSETGNTLTGIAKAERQAMKTNVIRPAYNKAFELAGDAKIDISNVVSEAESILGRKLSDFATETAPDTVSKLRQFVPRVPEVEAATIGKAGFKTARPPIPERLAPEATLEQLDDVRKAINADIASANTSNAPMSASKLKNLYALQRTIDDAIGKSTTLGNDAKNAYANAVSTYRTEYAPRFGEGVNAQLFKRTSLSEDKIRAEDVVNKYFGGETEAENFTKLFRNNPDAMKVGRNGIENLFRQKVLDVDGQVVPSKVKGFLQDNKRVIDVFDKAGMDLRPRLEAINRDAQRLTQIAEEAAASGNKLRPALPPGSNALATEKRITDLTRNLTPKQLANVNAVRDDLARELEYERLATAGGSGSSDIKKLATTAGKETGIAPMVNVLYWPIAIYNKVVGKLLTSLDEKTALELAREMTSPSIAAQTIRKAMTVKGEQEATNALARQTATRIAPGISAQGADPNQNAMTNRIDLRGMENNERPR